MEQIHSTTSKRKWKQLTEKDRYHLEAYFNAGMKTQEIVERMGYSNRTIEREWALGLTKQLKPASKDIKTCGDLQKQWVYLADVAQRLGMSEATLRRRLANEGASFRELLGNIKMMRALTLLQTSPLGVAQVAYAVGYESPARFAAKFRAHFGCTPSDVRKAA